MEATDGLTGLAAGQFDAEERPTMPQADRAPKRVPRPGIGRPKSVTKTTMDAMLGNLKGFTRLEVIDLTCIKNIHEWKLEDLIDNYSD